MPGATKNALEPHLSAETFDYHYGNLRATYADQRRFQDKFGLIAPMLSVRSLSMGLAGTDLLGHRSQGRVDDAERIGPDAHRTFNRQRLRASAALADE